MSEAYIGEIRLFAGNFAPRGWQFCSGQLLSIAQNTALFSILGTTYGGNGQTTFALPDLRGRVPVHPGQGPGLSPYNLGEQGGSETVTLLTTQMPAHTHTVSCSNAAGDTDNPTGAILAAANDPNTRGAINAYATTPTATMSPAMVGAAGGGQPHQNIQPFTCLNYIICMEGIYPSRN